MSGSARFLKPTFKNNTGMKTIELQTAGRSDSAKQNQISDYIAAHKFEIGDVYLFHKSDPRCPSDSSLWGVFDKSDGGTVFLESSSSDCEEFRTWCRLPEGYRFCRPATRTEMRQYIFEQTWDESRRILGMAK